MNKRTLRKEFPLKISIYPQSNGKAELVFRKNGNRILHRIRVSTLKPLLSLLENPEPDLNRPLVLELQGIGTRRWVLELGIVNDADAVLNLWEVSALRMQSRFEWKGSAEDLKGLFPL